MADGSYERRGPREAELKRLQRIIEAARRKAGAAPAAAKDPPAPRDGGSLRLIGKAGK